MPKLRRGRRSGKASRARSYPMLDELRAFGRKVGGACHFVAVMTRVQESMGQTLALAERSSAVPSGFCWLKTVDLKSQND